MAEKMSGKGQTSAGKPVPMKLFSTWEVDRTPPNCTPRLCSMNITRLVVVSSLGNDLTSVIVAVKMQSSKRTLRSNDIAISQNGLVDTELDLTFSLAYPHFLKRGGNYLQIMLQRRKRYKNRPMLGYKTLAVGLVDMDQVLQRSQDKELELFVENKEKSTFVAKISVLNLSSQPVDHEESEQRHKLTITTDHSDRIGDADTYSEEEEEFSSNEDGSDSEPMMDDTLGLTGPVIPNKAGSRKMLPPAARQKNFKQKFIALLKKFKVTDEGLDSEQDHEELEQKIDQEMDPLEFEDLFDEIDDLSESGAEMDNMSVSSTPKPSLRPFFSSSRSLVDSADRTVADRLSDEGSKKADSDSHPETWTDHEHSDSQMVAGSPPKGGFSDESANKRLSSSSEKKNKLFTKDKSTSFKDKNKQMQQTIRDKSSIDHSNSLCQTDNNPRKALLDQLTKILPTEDYIPDYIILVNTAELIGQTFAQKLLEKQYRVITTCSVADVRAVIVCLMGKIQKFCNSNAKTPLPIRVVIGGSDSYINSILRPYVEQMSGKPSEWLTYMKFLIVPISNGPNSLAKYLCNVDVTYQASFGDQLWRDCVEKVDNNNPKTDFQELINRTGRFINSPVNIIHLPIAEAMVTYKEKSSAEESSQIFIPFIHEVKIGGADNSTSTSVDMDELCIQLPSQLSGSPPSSAANPLDKPKDQTTPPSSPNVATSVPHSAVAGGGGLGGAAGGGSGGGSGGGGGIGGGGGGGMAVTIGGSTGPIPLISIGPPPQPLEPMELQIDYWCIPLKADKDKESNKRSDAAKSTIKSTFRSVQVTRLNTSASTGEFAAPTLTMLYVTKEKKQKIMRLGKKKEKEKDFEAKSQVVDGINRLICLARTHPLKLSVDGAEWHAVKFFQLSAQWQTHVKHFPLAVFLSTNELQTNNSTS
ncbi:hypothetical protein CHUAL_006242 [Chamberlinius hualienensis]